MALCQGLINAFDLPARQAFVIEEMIDDRKDLTATPSPSTPRWSTGRSWWVHSRIAGVVIAAAVGEGFCFLIDGISYIAARHLLLAMHITRIAPPKKLNPALPRTRETASLKYVIVISRDSFHSLYCCSVL